ncbi:MAG: GNAT family N-acetyltransferase [Chloroflexi bacterium]|nr:GNAT family N-acetyltransferase [Chloroflexota bacterium]
MKALNRQATLVALKATLAADFACPAAYFSESGVFINEAKELPGRRRFPFRPKALAMMTMGTSVVISCSADRLAWAQTHLSPLNRDTLFSAATFARLDTLIAPDQQRIAGPDPKFVCASDTFRPASIPTDIFIDLVTQTHIQALYAHTGFYNALSYQLNNPCPDVLATVAYHHQTVIGIAGASADSDQMWQVGVDVLPAYQNRGIGQALVSQLTATILAEGKIPYYTTAVANLRSSRLALSLGYWPAWIEVYARDR